MSGLRRFAGVPFPAPQLVGEVYSSGVIAAAGTLREMFLPHHGLNADHSATARNQTAGQPPRSSLINCVGSRSPLY